MIVFAFLGVLLFSELFYFLLVFKSLDCNPVADFDLVVAYSDSNTEQPALDLALSRDKPLYVSQAPWERYPFPKCPAADLKKITVDPTAQTTDQNARRAVAFIKRGGYKRVALMVGWFHLPRALFLTRLYLLGSGVTVIPCAKSPLPTYWWKDWLLHREIFKFWGSLGRVALAACGWETGSNGEHFE